MERQFSKDFTAFRGVQGGRRAIRIVFVCRGNICRSPMAEFIMKDIARREGREGDFVIESRGTHCEEPGAPPHRGAAAKLRAMGVRTAPHAATRLRGDDYGRYDLIIGMDSYNVSDIKRLFGGDPEGKVRRLLDFTSSPRDIDDPWYTEDFDTAYGDIAAGCEALFSALKQGRA